MAKKNTFNLANVVDMDLVDSLSMLESPIAPTKKEVELVKAADGDIVDIPIENLVEYHNHTFKVIDNADMDLLVDSIRDNGIILPLIVRELTIGRYEIISGHRRRFAAEKLGLKTVPCKVMDLDDDAADIISTDTNIAREIILPSEKAKTYRLRMDAAIRMGKKTVDEIKSVAEDAPDSVRKIQRYLKLSELSPALLDMVDEGKIPVTAGTILADMSVDHQNVIYDTAKELDKGISLKDAEKLKKASSRGLTRETAQAILKGELKPRKTTTQKKKAVLTEDLLFDVVPDRIKELPLDERVDFYKAAIKAYLPLIEK